jgi:hypothetical protein
VTDRGKAVCNYDGGPADTDVGDRALDGRFGFAIEGGCGFIQDQDRRLAENGASETEPLALSAREFEPSFAGDGFIFPGKLLNEPTGVIEEVLELRVSASYFQYLRQKLDLMLNAS